MKFEVRRITYEVEELDPGELMAISEAARVLGMTIPGVRSAMDRGQFTEVVDPDAVEQRFRRYLLRQEVEDLAARRERSAEKRAAIEAA